MTSFEFTIPWPWHSRIAGHAQASGFPFACRGIGRNLARLSRNSGRRLGRSTPWKLVRRAQEPAPSRHSGSSSLPGLQWPAESTTHDLFRFLSHPPGSLAWMSRGSRSQTALPMCLSIEATLLPGAAFLTPVVGRILRDLLSPEAGLAFRRDTFKSESPHPAPVSREDQAQENALRISDQIKPSTHRTKWRPLAIRARSAAADSRLAAATTHDLSSAACRAGSRRLPSAHSFENIGTAMVCARPPRIFPGR